LNTTIKVYNLATIKNLGQFLIMRDTVTSGQADVVIKTPDEPDPIVPGGESVSLLVYSNQQGVQLPVITLATLATLGTPVGGQLAFLTDSAAIVYFNGTLWKKVLQEPILQYSASSAPDTFGTLSLPGTAANTSSLLKLSGGLVNLPAFASTAILDIENPTPGMLIYDNTSKQVRCYNGNAWQPLSTTSTSIPVSAAPAALVPGIAINQNFKSPSSVMDINPAGGKAFLMPKLDPDQIYAPVAGLICFNPSTNKLMLYDGLHWNVVK
jgi:hypothetical protein